MSGRQICAPFSRPPLPSLQPEGKPNLLFLNAQNDYNGWLCRVGNAGWLTGVPGRELWRAGSEAPRNGKVFFLVHVAILAKFLCVRASLVHWFVRFRFENSVTESAVFFFFCLFFYFTYFTLLYFNLLYHYNKVLVSILCLLVFALFSIFSKACCKPFYVLYYLEYDFGSCFSFHFIVFYS